MVRTFYRISKLIVSAVAQHNLTMPQFDILATLRFSEGVTQQELAERLLVTKGNVCGVLDRLEALKWVERRPDANDGRANRLYLTAAGRRKIDAVLPDHDAQVMQSMRTLSTADVKSLRRLLIELERANAA
jgi:DNA-binding MarR family transcriptional regulator